MTVTPSPPPIVAPPKRGGCWKWGAIGCLAVLIIAAIGIGGIVVLVFGAIKSTDAYRGARATAERDPRVIAALGAPVHPGIWIIGNVNVNNNRGNADFQFPIIGSRSRGRLHAVAYRDISGWHYTELTVTPRDGPTIDLLRE